MADTVSDLYLRMEAAAARLDFEAAKRLRDRINLIRGGSSEADTEHVDTSGLARQTPGAMGLGSSRQRPIPPKGWTPPVKPDLMTSGHSRKRRPVKKVGDE